MTMSSPYHPFDIKASHGFHLGAFSIDERGDVWVEHSIIADRLYREELAGSVISVALIADEYDDQIVASWGGLTAREQLDSQSL